MFELCRKDAQYVASQKAKFEADVKKNPKLKLPVIFFSGIFLNATYNYIR